MRDDPDQNKQLLYCRLIENLSKNVASRIRTTNDVVIDALKKELLNTKARLTLGIVIICVALIMSFYVIAFEFLKKLQVGSGLGSSLLVTISSIIVITGIFIAIKKHHISPTLFGLTLQNWRQSVRESLLFTIPLLLLILIGKWLLIKYLPTWHNRALFELFTNQNDPTIFFTGLSLINFLFYLIFVPFQELIVRGALQSPLEELFISPHRQLLAILMSNLLFSVTHIHLSMALALPIFLLGLFWGWLYTRAHTLIGVITSHWIVGIWALFIVNIRPSIVG